MSNESDLISISLRYLNAKKLFDAYEGSDKFSSLQPFSVEYEALTNEYFLSEGLLYKTISELANVTTDDKLFKLAKMLFHIKCAIEYNTFIMMAYKNTEICSLMMDSFLIAEHNYLNYISENYG